jgi:hypothetical protein
MAQFPQLNDSQNNLLAKIAANTGESQPRVGDGQHNLLFKIAQNTYASAVTSSSALQSSGDNYVLVQPGDDLAAKYAEAKAKSPSASNRITVFIIPGTYSLSSELAIDAGYVDLVGLGAQFQSPAVIVSNNTLNVTANDVRVSGISVGTQQFKIADNKPLQVFENCVGGNNSFGGGGTASGTFVGCIGGDDSFGGYDITQSSTSTFNGCVAGTDGFGGNASEYPSGKYISCRVTSGIFPTIYIPGRARFCLDEDYNIVNADGGYDSDVESFITAANVTDATAKNQLNLFVIGIKRLGLWGDMVCWPLRSTQNAGTGSTAYSLGGLGTYNGTLVNGPTWGADGIQRNSGANGYISIPSLEIASYGEFSILGAISLSAVANGSQINLLSVEYNTDSVTATGRIGIYTQTDGTRNILVQAQNTLAQEIKREFVSTTSTITDNTFHFFGGSIAPQPTMARTLTRNGSSVGSNSGSMAGAWDAIGANSAILATQFGNTGYTAKFSFVMFISNAISTSNQNDVYSLYKSTLGQGLGLP